jgi:hypothetical protein
MKMSPAGVAQKANKAYIKQSRSQSTDPDTLGKYIMCLDGASEVWFYQMEGNTLSSMQSWGRETIREKGSAI